MKKLPSLFYLPFVLCPFTVQWTRFAESQNFGLTTLSTEWKALYVFGLRVAMWRADV